MGIIQGDGFKVSIIKSSRRKTLALKITHKGVSIHIPSTLPISMAETFVEQKTPWIQQKLRQQSQRQPQERQFTDEEAFFFLGEPYALRLVQQNTTATVNKTQQHIEFHGRLNRLSKKSIRSFLIHWYK